MAPTRVYVSILLVAVLLPTVTFPATTEEPDNTTTAEHTTEEPIISTTAESNGDKNKTLDRCDSDIFPCSDKIVGNLMLIVFYGLTLACAAKLISDGAEMLLDLNFPPSIIGGVVLPVMGAVPDSVMILVSGLGSIEEAQDQISVGMGTLAGSTIMLLTIAWGLSLLLGRMDVRTNDEGEKDCVEKQSTGFSLFLQGVPLGKEISVAAIGMMVTSVPYLIIQSSDWKFGPTRLHEKQPDYVRWAAFSTMIICFLGFIVYLVSQIYMTMNGENPVVEVHAKMRKERLLAHAAHGFLVGGQKKKFARVAEEGGEEETEEQTAARVTRSAGSMWKMRSKARATVERQETEDNDRAALVESSSNSQSESREEEGEEDKVKIALHAFSRLIGGVALVTFFSDPMCGALTALTNTDYAEHIPISAFYVSFVVTPLCSNASELVSSLLLAMQKEKDKINMTYSQIYGACIMNNTLCLGVFCALVFVRDLEWYFSAEVTVILLFEVVMGITAVVYRKIYPVYLFIVVLVFYPFSLGMVAFMENVLKWG